MSISDESESKLLDGGHQRRLVRVMIEFTKLGEIDTLNATLEPLRSFVLPGGHPAAAHLHVARTVCRRAERLMTELALLPGELVSPAAAQYVNRLSDFLFVASRHANAVTGAGDVLWVPGKTAGG